MLTCYRNMHNIESGASACVAKENVGISKDAVRLGFELPERHPTTGLAASGILLRACADACAIKQLPPVGSGTAP